MKRPSFQFYPADWLSDTKLRACSMEARGLAIDLFCIMHDHDPYGHCPNSVPTLARLLGEDPRKLRRLLAELLKNGVIKSTDHPDFSRTSPEDRPDFAPTSPRHRPDLQATSPRSSGNIGMTSPEDRPNFFYSSRLVRDEQIREKRINGGKLGGNPVLKKVNHEVNQDCEHDVNHNGYPAVPPPSSSSAFASSVLQKTQDVKTPPNPPSGEKRRGDHRAKEEYPDTFLRFWAAYPKKKGKDAALKCWLKRNPPIDDVLMALEWQKSSHDWTKEGGQFIPDPTTYLNQGRWKDEPAGPIEPERKTPLTPDQEWLAKSPAARKYWIDQTRRRWDDTPHHDRVEWVRRAYREDLEPEKFEVWVKFFDGLSLPERFDYRFDDLKATWSDRVF